MRTRLAFLTSPFQGKAGSNTPNKDAFLFLAPYLTLFGLFILWPALNGIWMSFHNWDLLFPRKPFIGLENYKNILVLFFCAKLRVDNWCWIYSKDTEIECDGCEVCTGVG